MILLVFGGTHEGSVFDLEKLIFGSTKFWNYLQKAKSPYNLFFASEKEKIAPWSKRRYFFSKIAFFPKKNSNFRLFFHNMRGAINCFHF